MIFSVVAPNLTRLQIGVIVRQMFQRSKDSSLMKIAVTLLVILVVVGSAKFGGAQQPSPISNASPIATPTGNADSNRNRQPDTYSNAHTCCHSAPAVWPAHFALTRLPGSGCAARLLNCYPSAARVVLPLKFLRIQKIKSPPRRIPRRAYAGLMDGLANSHAPTSKAQNQDSCS